ncbi:hypothetical protein PYW08_001535 [Mythimna loreyi]|uniref:Uncharacterized protein n=1 Tax=Mythimna loreyi TaxID=667449 RepID=A0ACC2R6X0_9NEOP|nr:hypothetical protein PYW08_001535 [Mythimna loreyi]
MTLPPFPSQDLAKLVLGYLAEEQLMTAYDEFLQASPYLDALRNEYDRIFMTSLRNILAEYRAVKIYVETCKPLILRKKLLQCTTLLDVVKFLASNADINKLQAQDTSFENISLVKQNTSQTSKQNVCEHCNSSNLSGCSCKSKQRSNVSASFVETSCLETSVETTALEDLPGNHVTTRKKHVRVIEKDTTAESNMGLSDATKQPSSALNNCGSGLNTLNSNTNCSEINPTDSSSLPPSSINKPADTPECREKIEEFNTILKKVCKNKSQAEGLNKSIPNASSFQDFASGVGGHENRHDPVPDSSTSENSIAMTTVANNTNTDFGNNLSEVAKSAELESHQYNNYPYPRIKPKCKDQKIKILSDIKVDKPFPSLNNSKAATSTPLMQTIVINGTPAYKQKLPIVNNNFTKDEIMAMPTIIVVPATGPPPKNSQSKPVLAHKLQKVKTKSESSPKLLGPLVIDISSSNAAETNKPDDKLPNINQQPPAKEAGLVKTIDVIKNASVPKDNVISGALQTSTPQVLPPVRKSSSTPRRNSHIRVLDFTTPRRILHETINEIVPNESEEKSVEMVVAKSPNLIFSETGNSENNIVDMSNVKVHKIETCHYNKPNLTKDSDKKTPVQKKNWDADLRALATTSGFASQPPPKPKPRPRRPKNKKAAESQSEQDKTTDKITDKADDTLDRTDRTTDKVDKTTDEADKSTNKADKTTDRKPRGKRKMSPKPKKSKKRRKLEEEEEQYAQTETQVESTATVKPTFNVVPANTYIEPEVEKVLENNQNQNKSNNEDNNETPEAERLSLHNEIGARLNISEFLETPYKQVLYDIQMETPKFLNSVLPDEPISDIKIMNIPTPRFFDTPKPLATPSSYSSRPTDYSSGGSYYKPDDQDYLRIADIECPVTSSKEVEVEVVPHVEVPKETPSSSKRSSRPVRKCTKNVSYVNSSNIGNKTKEKAIDDKVEIASSSSDTTIANSSFETSKEANPKTPRSNKLKSTSKAESSKKRLESIKKRKSPMKKDKSNSFMKIKPRRPTPTKESSTKRTRWKKDIFSPSKPQINKKITAKEKNIHITPVVAPAPTKSRRKSSTPRKLHCTKTFNSESSGHESPDINVTVKPNVTRDQTTASVVSSHDSDTEQIALRWSDDGSQDAKLKEGETEDITKIQQYIETTVNTKHDYKDNAGSLHGDLIKRGFDAETAKIIERDLLDSPSAATGPPTATGPPIHVEVTESRKEESILDKSVETNTSVTSELQIVQDAESDDEVELSIYECNEDSHNYIKCNSDAKDRWKQEPAKLKDKFSMEVCIDDGVAIRLRATNFNMLFSNDPEGEGELGYSFRETEVAVSSISNIDRLYTPMKDHKAQCFEIFDSTLTSLDTPLKVHSPSNKEQKITEIEIVLEEEKVDVKDKVDIKKRKRLQDSNSSEEATAENKNIKPETQYLFNSTNIQDIDIESVLKKLHGP